MLEAALAQLPEGLLEQLQTRAARLRQSSTGSAGAQHRHQNRGRPTGVFRGDYRRGGRVNILATLRAAAPWQLFRRREQSEHPNQEMPRQLQIRRDDIHLTRFQQRRETLTLFVVDASGSAALQRLAEAKGAVELLLADCYVRRDQVALIAFRDEAAELLLPPTRSLVRAKKALAALPGGGATPMAAALDLTREMVERASKQGTTMQYVILTDGAANVARDGTRNREAGTQDALTAARVLAASPCQCTGHRHCAAPTTAGTGTRRRASWRVYRPTQSRCPHPQPRHPRREHMTSRAAWEAVADFWPRADTSQFVRAAEIDFHVQVSGSGDDVLMLHGAGASSHSFADWRTASAHPPRHRTRPSGSGLLDLAADRCRGTGCPLPTTSNRCSPPSAPSPAG